MDRTNIKELLDRYFEGVTTLEEEQILKQYFLNDLVAPDFEQYRSLFVFFTQEKEQVISTDFKFDERPIPMITNKKRRIWKWAVAATITLALFSWFLAGQPTKDDQLAQKIDWNKYEPENNEQAVSLALAAFKKTSVAMKKGTETVTTEVIEVKELMQSLK